MISTPHCPAPGDQVDLVLQIPAGRPPIPLSTFRMDMKAEVVRLLLDSTGKKICGFAVRKRDQDLLAELNSVEFALEQADLASLREN